MRETWQISRKCWDLSIHARVTPMLMGPWCLISSKRVWKQTQKGRESSVRSQQIPEVYDSAGVGLYIITFDLLNKSETLHEIQLWLINLIAYYIVWSRRIELIFCCFFRVSSDTYFISFIIIYLQDTHNDIEFVEQGVAKIRSAKMLKYSHIEVWSAKFT